MVTWNTADVSPAALRRLLDTDQGCELRLFVRDNASKDGTPQAVADMVPEAEIDAGDKNLGFSAGVNSLIGRTRAPWIFVLNPDAWPLPDAIGRLVQAAERHPRAAAVAPRLESPNGTLQHSTHSFPSIRAATIATFAWGAIPKERADELFFEGSWMHDRPRRLDWAHGAALLIRREALQEIGGFDERFFMYAEDLEWCWRAQRHGWEIWFEPSAVVRHVTNVSGAQRFGRQRTRAHLHNFFRFYIRAHGLPSAVIWWSVTISGPLLRWVRALLRRDRDGERYWRDSVAAHLIAPFAREHRD